MWNPIQPPIDGAASWFRQEIKKLGLEADNSSTYNAEIKNERNYTFIPKDSYIAWRLNNHPKVFIFYLYYFLCN